MSAATQFAASQEAPRRPQSRTRAAQSASQLPVGGSVAAAGFRPYPDGAYVELGLSGAAAGQDLTVSIDSVAGITCGSAALVVFRVGGEAATWDSHPCTADPLPVRSDWTYQPGDQLVLIGEPTGDASAMGMVVSLGEFSPNWPPSTTAVPFGGSGEIIPADQQFPFSDVHFDAYEIPVPAGRELLVCVRGTDDYQPDYAVLSTDGQFYVGTTDPAGFDHIVVEPGDILVVAAAVQSPTNWGGYKLAVASPADPVTAVRATPITGGGGSDNLAISWDTGYRGYYNITAAQPDFQVTVTGSATNLHLRAPGDTRSLTARVTDYDINVSVAASSGTYPGAEATAAVTVTVARPTGLTAPQGLSLGRTATELVLSWEPVATLTEDPLRYYEVTSREGTHFVAGTRLQISGASIFQENTLTVRAITRAGAIGPATTMVVAPGQAINTDIVVATAYPGTKQAFVKWSYLGNAMWGVAHQVTVTADTGASCTLQLGGNTNSQASSCWVKGLRNEVPTRMTLTVHAGGIEIMRRDLGTVTPTAKRFTVGVAKTSANGFQVAITPKTPQAALKYTLQVKKGRKWVKVKSARTSRTTSYMRSMNLGGWAGLKPGSYRIVVPTQRGIKGATSPVFRAR